MMVFSPSKCVINGKSTHKWHATRFLCVFVFTAKYWETNENDCDIYCLLCGAFGTKQAHIDKATTAKCIRATLVRAKGKKWPNIAHMYWHLHCVHGIYYILYTQYSLSAYFLSLDCLVQCLREILECAVQRSKPNRTKDNNFARKRRRRSNEWEEKKNMAHTNSMSCTKENKPTRKYNAHTHTHMHVRKKGKAKKKTVATQKKKWNAKNSIGKKPGERHIWNVRKNSVTSQHILTNESQPK